MYVQISNYYKIVRLNILEPPSPTPKIYLQYIHYCLYLNIPYAAIAFFFCQVRLILSYDGITLKKLFVKNLRLEK